MTDSGLICDLFDSGLLQFGRFAVPGGVRPFQHHLAMLASYPALLGRVAQGLADSLGGVDRLLCNRDCTPLGVAVALETGLPMVIGQGDGADGARDFVGAYDIGHPAALIAHQTGEVSAAMIHHAGRFGLDVRQIASVLNGGDAALSIPAFSLLNLTDVVNVLLNEGRIPGPLAVTALQWLEERTSPRRPD